MNNYEQNGLFFELCNKQRGSRSWFHFLYILEISTVSFAAVLRLPWELEVFPRFCGQGVSPPVSFSRPCSTQAHENPSSALFDTSCNSSERDLNKCGLTEKCVIWFLFQLIKLKFVSKNGSQDYPLPKENDVLSRQEVWKRVVYLSTNSGKC